MKHRIKCIVHSVEDSQGNLHIIAKFDYHEILKSVVESRGSKFNRILLTLLNIMPFNVTSQVTKRKSKKTERMLLKSINKQSYGKTKQIQLRSNILPTIITDISMQQSNNDNIANNANNGTIASNALDVNKDILYKGDEICSDYEAIGVRRKITKWTSNDFLIYMGHKFEKTYGLKSLELMPNIKKRGVIYSMIKQSLIVLFEQAGHNKVDLKNYIDWVYDVKSDKIDFPITFNFLKYKGLVTEFLTKTKGRKKVKRTKRELLKQQ